MKQACEMRADLEKSCNYFKQNSGKIPAVVRWDEPILEYVCKIYLQLQLLYNYMHLFSNSIKDSHSSSKEIRNLSCKLAWLM